MSRVASRPRRAHQQSCVLNERVAPYVSIVGFGFERPCASITPAGIPEVYRKSYDTLAAGSAVAAASPPDSWLYTPPRWIDSLSSRRRRRAGGDGDGVTAGGGASGDGGGGATASAGGGGGGAMPVTQISTSGHSFHALPSPPRSLSRCSHSVVTSTKWMCGWLALHDEKPWCIAAFRSRPRDVLDEEEVLAELRLEVVAQRPGPTPT